MNTPTNKVGEEQAANRFDDMFSARANKHSVARRAFIRNFLVSVSLFLLIGAGFYWWSQRQSERVILEVGTGPVGSDSNMLMREVADVVKRHSKSLRLLIRASSDSSQNISLLNNRKIDLATIRSDTPVISDIRIIANLFPDYYQLIIRQDAHIEHFNDLTKANIAIPAFGSDGFQFYWTVASHYNLPLNGLYWHAVDFGQATKGLISGKYDAMFTVSSLRDQNLLRMFEDAQLKGLALGYLPIEQAAAIALKRPFLKEVFIPKGAFSGPQPVPQRVTPTVAVSRILVSRSDIPNRAIRELTKILFNHRLDLTIRFSLASSMYQPDSVNGLSIPLHQGAQDFFTRNEPSFVQENAEPLALGVTLLTLIVTGLFALRRNFGNRQKNSADVFNYQLLELNAKARGALNRDEIDALRDELDNILEKMVMALDTDEVSDEGFQSFALLWETVRDRLIERRAQV